jgi:hypothetical protein
MKCPEKTNLCRWEVGKWLVRVRGCLQGGMVGSLTEKGHWFSDGGDESILKLTMAIAAHI